MSGLEHFGKLLIVIGLVIILIGAFFLLSGKISWIGKLPGDILIQKKNFTFYFPLATSIIISIILSLLIWLFSRR
ncbi:MAG: DUF2905 domain-containing protein [Thermodesulfovibrionales bacterium]|nr:DUF2905 domain-containing protein [Thermodesulfovibrionales bacterium]